MGIAMTISGRLLTATVCTVLGGLAQAQTISGSDIRADYYNPGYSDSFSVRAYSPWTATTELGLRTQDGFTGVGVQGMTNGEIDWRNGRSEWITLSLANPSTIASFTLGLLFNGPEYSDVQEAASITINGNQTYTLRTGGAENVANWSLGSTLLGSFNYLAGAGTQLGQGGAVMVTNPFGSTLVSSISFAAAQGFSGGLCGSGGCTNQSDYNVISVNAAQVTAVPEPQTYALMLAGLGVLAFVARRRRPQAV